MAREKRLEDDEWAIIYAAAYLRYFIDIWESEYPEIAARPEMLGSLYNLGHQQTSPHGDPKPNDFGLLVKEYYNLMGCLLG